MTARPPKPRARLRLHALSINEVRDLFGADHATRSWATKELGVLVPGPPPPTPRGGWLSRRLFHPRRTVPDPRAPGLPDMMILLEGAYAPPERAYACWSVLEHLVTARAWGTLELDLDERAVADFDFALVRAGVPAVAGLGRLLRADLRLGLTPDPGVVAGYQPFASVHHDGRQIADAHLDDEQHAATARELGEFLCRFPEWARAAEAANRGVPDLIAFHWRDGPEG